MLNVAVVGLGHMGIHHALEVVRHRLCRLTDVVDIQESKVREFLTKERLTDLRQSTFQEVIQNKDIQLLCISSYDDAHFDQVMASLTAHKHVFVEKPLCQTFEQLQNIVATYAKGSLFLASNLLLRTAPLYIHLKYLIETGQLGEVYAFDGDYLYGRVHKITDEWRKDVLNYSVMEGGGIHMVDLMLWLTGQRPVSVFSQINKIATKNTQFRYHDFQSALFSFHSGLVGRITANFGCVHHHQHVLRVFGTKGTFIYDDQGARIHWRRDDPPSSSEVLSQAPKPEKKTLLLNQFVEDIVYRKQQNLAQREFDLMSVVLAADKAINKHLNIEYVS